MSQPTIGVQYRLQSVDYGTYFELLDTTAAATTTVGVSLRPKKTTRAQLWTFEKVSGSSYYYVRSVANPNQTLTYSSGYVYSVSPNTTYSQVAVLNTNSDSSQLAFIISNSTYYFYTNDNDTRLYSTTTNNINLDRWKFRLVPSDAEPSELQPGLYRIRNINGKSLLTMPDLTTGGGKNVYARSQRIKDPYQRWNVTIQANGQYAIQNAGNDAYLGPPGASFIAGDALTGKTSVFNWSFRSVGGFAWSFRVPDTELSVGVADYELHDGDEVAVVPINTTPTQVWFFEKFIPLGQDQLHADRLLNEGKYLIQSSHDTATYMTAASSPWRITPGTATSSKFILKYKDTNSPNFTLTYDGTGSPVVADVDDYVGFTKKGTEFVLLGKRDSDSGYVICLAGAGDSHRVVSSRTITDINKNNVFAIDDLSEGAIVQKWNFIAQ